MSRFENLRFDHLGTDSNNWLEGHKAVFRIWMNDEEAF